MRRLLLSLAGSWALVLILGLPAHGVNIDYDDTGHYPGGPTCCEPYDWFSLTVGWKADPDGRGIIVGAMDVSPHDCGQYEAHPAHINRLTIRDGRGVVKWQRRDFDMTRCDWLRSMRVEVNRSLCADVWLSLDPKVDNWDDPGTKRAHVQICAT